MVKLAADTTDKNWRVYDSAVWRITRFSYQMVRDRVRCKKMHRSANFHDLANEKLFGVSRETDNGS
jgi:hypothetical protein